jgi:hypothetical protein
MGNHIQAIWRGTLIACALTAAACSSGAQGGETLSDENDGAEAAEAEGETGRATQALSSATCVDIRRDKGFTVEDTFIASDRPTKNWGTNINVLAGKVNGGVRRTLFKFDTASIPKRARVTSATLKLHILNDYNAAGTQLKVHRVTAPWTESAVTWQSFNNAFDPQPLASQPSAPGAFNVDVKALVQSWVTHGLPGSSGTLDNYGFIVDLPVPYASGYTTFRSSEVDVSYTTNYPTLQVCYVVQGPPATEIVNAGTTSTSPNYKAVYTLGQSSQNQGKMTSPGFRAQGGLIGATGTLP